MDNCSHYLKHLVDGLAAELPLQLRKETFKIVMCADPQQAEHFIQECFDIVKTSGLLFLHFFCERFFSNPAAIGVASIEGKFGLLPLRFYCKKLNIEAIDLLQCKLPTLEKLLRDPNVAKVVENMSEFCGQLFYLSWHRLSIRPFLDTDLILPEVGVVAKHGFLLALRSIFPATNQQACWNGEESICRGNNWQVPNYPRTYLFQERPYGKSSCRTAGCHDCHCVQVHCETPTFQAPS